MRNSVVLRRPGLDAHDIANRSSWDITTLCVGRMNMPTRGRAI
jgi:hypothetical protein